ncbi:MAG: Holliday junction resolvase [Candidatus Thermoplasmatota archaeon]|nr:Holliday junction resolvase [Candidatus Thermoplasmatota archaeon]
MGHAYERELRGLLAGENQVVDRLTRTGSDDLVRAYRTPLKAPFHVVRAAGSLGDGDLVAMRNGFAFLLEVKSAARDTVHFSESSGALQEQAEELSKMASQAGTLALYAFRLKGHRKKDPWRLFTVPSENLNGRAAILARRTPELPTTDSGTFVLRWDQGRPLHEFLTHYYSVFEDGVSGDLPLPAVPS